MESDARRELRLNRDSRDDVEVSKPRDRDEVPPQEMVCHLPTPDPSLHLHPMKPLLLIPLTALPLLFSACETVLVDRGPQHASYADRSVYYYYRDRPYPPRSDRDVAGIQPNSHDRPKSTARSYEHGDVVVSPSASVTSITPSRPYRRNPAAIPPREAYRPRAEVRYYHDNIGRYYFRDGRRVYSNAGVHYY